MMNSMLHNPKRLRNAILTAAFWAAVWQISSMAVGLPLLLPGPLQVAEALIHLCGETAFWSLIALTLLRILGGFFLGATLGGILSVLTTFLMPCKVLLTPAVRVVRATPVASFILLCMLWLKSDFVPAFIAGLMVLPIIWGNLSEGFQRTDRQLLEMANMFEMGKLRTFFWIYLPTALPYLRASCLTALGMAWKSGVAAEVLCQPRKAVGTQLYFAKIYLETENLFAWTLVVVALSILMEHLFAHFAQRFLPARDM